jgi:starch synthase
MRLIVVINFLWIYMTVVISHPTGNANLRAVLRGLHNKNLLHTFYTTIAFPQVTWSKQLTGESIDRYIGKRRFSEIPWQKIRLHPFRELVRLTASFLKVSSLIRHEKGWASVDAVYASLDSAVAKALEQSHDSIRAVYAYEDGALNTFRRAKEKGIICLYDLPIPYWRALRRLCQEESELLPEWSSTMRGLEDSDAKLRRKDEELYLSDHIFVASNFTRASLKEYFGDDLHISMVHYGCPHPLISHPIERRKGEPLQLFYAGSMTQRKGIAYMIAALNMLEIDWRLTLAGSIEGEPPPALKCFLSDSRCNWLGALPHATLMEAMTHAHVFVFPSIAEGFGMVITEAIAAGLPVITTVNTAGLDILTDGYDGFIVGIRDPNVIAERITMLAENESLRFQMSCNALQTAHKLSWKIYETQLANLIQEIISA